MITVYTGPNCTHCTTTKRALERAGLAFKEFPITDADRAAFRKFGYRSLPVVIVCNEDGELVDEWCGLRPDKINQLSAWKKCSKRKRWRSTAWTAPTAEMSSSKTRTSSLPRNSNMPRQSCKRPRRSAAPWCGFCARWPPRSSYGTAT